MTSQELRAKLKQITKHHAFLTPSVEKQIVNLLIEANNEARAESKT